MGKMVADARGAVEAMINLDFIDGNKVYVAGNEELIPVDFHEVLASIAPRPLLVFSPVYDKDAHLHDVKLSAEQAWKIYNLYGDTENIILN